ncbi:DUF397 domain-containing protein [Nocardia sp. NPDC049526]|uniref:DUF397 domain-containing protein n=1 Tax=Nocardia sp. NPDC049526 TaxID=3364316 RepID=UPI0037B93227
MTSQDRLVWRTSSYSGTNGGQCVEVAFGGRSVFIRDSKYRRNPANDLAAEPVIEIPAKHWDTFLNAAVQNDAKIPAGLPAITRHGLCEVSIAAEDGTTLTFTAAEWIAFTAGVGDGEFAAAA